MRGMTMMSEMSVNNYTMDNPAMWAEMFASMTEHLGVKGGWVFYFKDDGDNLHYHHCATYDELVVAVETKWLGEANAVNDWYGAREAEWIVEELIDTGNFHAEDGSCYAVKV